MTDSQGMTYDQAGVDIQEGARAVDAIRAAVQSTYRPEVIGDIGGFGGLFSAAAFKDMEDPILVSGTDGVGTKLALAQRLGVQDTVGIDLVAMCVNDTLACGAEPLFFLDYIATGKLSAQAASTIVGGIAEGCRQAGCSLIGGEMAEHPGVMADDDYDLSGFCVAVVDRSKMVGPELVEEGDVLVGLASSGFHSNGYSLLRRGFADKLSDQELQEPQEVLGGKSLGQALLAPTRIYVKPVLQALAQGLPIHALAHITGGGITENLNRALPKGLDALVHLGTWQPVPVIDYVVGQIGLSQDEALKTFNMGIGMVLICAPDQADLVKDFMEQAGERAFIIGSIQKAADPQAEGVVLYA